MFVGDVKIEIFSDSINADLIGLNTTNNLETSRAYAINASQTGSTINIGKEGELSGDVTIGGKLIAYEGIGFYSGDALDGYTQNVSILSTAVIETLNGSMILDPGASGEIFGTFIARGVGSTIEIHTSNRLDIHGSLIAQEDIIITAGSEITQETRDMIDAAAEQANQHISQTKVAAEEANSVATQANEDKIAADLAVNLATQTLAQIEEAIAKAEEENTETTEETEENTETTEETEENIELTEATKALEDAILAQTQAEQVVTNAQIAKSTADDVLAEANAKLEEIVSIYTSIQTYGTGKIQTLTDGSKISLIGVNNENIDTTIELDGADLELIELGSTSGTLTIDKDSGRVETAGQIILSGKNLVLAGVIKSDYYTDVDYDYELEIQTTGNIDLSGDIQTKGSMLISGDGDVQIYNTSLIANEAGDKIKIYAGANLTLGTKTPTDGQDQTKATLIEANDSLIVEAGEILSIGYDAQLYSMIDNSTIDINAGTLNHVGVVRAGATVVFTDVITVEQSGVDASITINVDEAYIMGGKALDSDLNLVNRGTNLVATGTIDITTGADEHGIGMVVSTQSSLRSTDSLSITTDGSMQINGSIKANGVDADVSITSQGKIDVLGNLDIDATGKFTLDADVSIGATKTILIPQFITMEKTVKVAGGTMQQAVGTYTVKVSSGYNLKTYEKLVSYEKIDIGDIYQTMDIKLEQDGYYNESINTYKEFLIADS